MGVLLDRGMLESVQFWQKCGIAQETGALLSANLKTTVVTN
jgi:hypothetical protein